MVNHHFADIDLDGLILREPTKTHQAQKHNQNNGGSSIPKESAYQFQELGLGRSMVITPYVFRDERGEFIEVFHRTQFEERLGLVFAQDCISVNRLHTLRGLHGDFRTWKLIHCPKGAVLACIVDLNPESPTYFQSRKVRIDDKNRQILLVPPGFGNSYLVLEDNTVYSYKKTTYFVPGAEFTLAYDAKGTGIEWPEHIDFLLSQRDQTAPETRASFEAAMMLRNDLENNPFLDDECGVNPASGLPEIW